MNTMVIVIAFVVVGLALIVWRQSASPQDDLPESISDEDILAVAKKGNKIQAIKWYRAHHGTDLGTAKAAVEKMLSNGDASPSPTAETASDDDIRKIARQGHKIQAIKLYREVHGVDLKVAKEAVDQMCL